MWIFYLNHVYVVDIDVVCDITYGWRTIKIRKDFKNFIYRRVSVFLVLVQAFIFVIITRCKQGIPRDQHHFGVLLFTMYDAMKVTPILQ